MVIYIILLYNLLYLKTENYNISKDYFIGFFAEKTRIVDLQIGHAFIGVGKGVPFTCDMNGNETEMFGFYPNVHIEGGKSFWAGPVPGSVKTDVKTTVDNYVFKKIEFSDYIKVKIKMEEWKKKAYQLTKNDCISFFQDVAKLFDDIILPNRTKFITPNEYVPNFIQINKALNSLN